MNEKLENPIPGSVISRYDNALVLSKDGKTEEIRKSSAQEVSDLELNNPSIADASEANRAEAQKLFDEFRP
jgi:hypothetical protein